MKTAIIVDDIKLSRDLIKNLISYFEFPINIIAESSNGNEAKNLIIELNPDIVFMDIALPSCNGLVVIDFVKRHTNYSTSYIIISAYEYFNFAQQSIRLGVNDLLLKPISKQQFKDAVIKLLGDNFTENDLLNELLNYINKNFSQDITLEEIAKQFYTSSSSVSRLFKKHLNLTFTQYLNKERLKYAKQLLIDSTMSINEIASMAGYQNKNYFYKIFKEYYKITPGEFRKQKKWY